MFLSNQCRLFPGNVHEYFSYNIHKHDCFTFSMLDVCDKCRVAPYILFQKAGERSAFCESRADTFVIIFNFLIYNVRKISLSWCMCMCWRENDSFQTVPPIELSLVIYHCHKNCIYCCTNRSSDYIFKPFVNYFAAYCIEETHQRNMAEYKC